MDDAVGVEIANTGSDLPEIVTSLVLVEELLGPDLLKQAPISGKFEKQVDFLLICKEPIHLENVRVA